MKLNLTRPIVIFDLETTGLDILKDRIIQLSYIKVMPDGTETRQNHLVNPMRAIPKDVTEMTGITNEMVADKPKFKDIAAQLAEDFADCDFVGYNSNRFDIPMLAEEFLHAGIAFDFKSCALIDCLSIYQKQEKRNLAAAYKFYCGREMEEDFEAHRADQDTEATYRVLMGQLDMYDAANETEPERQLKNDVGFLAEFSKFGDNVDFAGRFVWIERKDAAGKPIKVEAFNFGKHKGVPVVDVLRKEPSYYNWMMNGDFPMDTKQTLERIRLKILAKKFNT